jgi:hypothetical protein
MMPKQHSRRSALKFAGAGLATYLSGFSPLRLAAETAELPSKRPAPADRKFRSAAVDTYIAQTCRRIGDPLLRWLFSNCFPNTLDTTVQAGEFEGQPDTVVLTGDIPAMWLRDSSAQVWAYLPLLRRDDRLRALVEGIIRRQTRCLLIDTYANAFMADLSAPPLPWSVHDQTEMRQGIGERKYELDSLCYPIRLAHGYWRATDDRRPFDAEWNRAMHRVVETMRVQQRKNGEGPYRFRRISSSPSDTLIDGIGSPANPVGMIASCFRPSDDACMLPFLVPSNLFAVTSLRQLAVMANHISNDAALANDAEHLAQEVKTALCAHAVAQTAAGTVWAYEVDGFGGQILMDDANVPSLLSLPYLESSPEPQLYARTRQMVWSKSNPWFFEGTAGEGVGGPHVGRDNIWPMSQIIYLLTSQSDAEILHALQMLKASSAGTGFIHESYNKNDVSQFTRPWFAWANSLFGEAVAKLAVSTPTLLAA